MDYNPQRYPLLTMAVLTINVFAVMTVVGLVSALLVDLSEEFNTTVGAVGQLITVSAVMWTLVAPVIGPFSDRIGRRRIIAGGLFVSGIALLGYSTAWEFSVLIGFSVLVGIGGAMAVPNVLASVGDHFSGSRMGRVMGLVAAGAPLAYLIGAPAGALIADNFGWKTSFLVLGLFMLALALANIVVLPVSRRRQLNESITYLSSFREAFYQKSLLRLLVANILAGWGFTAVQAYLAAFLVQSYSLSVGQVAPLLSFMAIGQLVGVFIGGLLADKFSKIKICAITPALLGLTGLILMLFPGNVWISVFLGGMVSGLFNSSRPAFFSLMVSVSSAIRGTVMGIQAVSNHLGRALGAMTGGLVLALAGYGYIGAVCIVLSLCASAIFFDVARLAAGDVPE